MAIEVAKYQFQSWVRKGISAQISEQDTLGNPARRAAAGRARLGADRRLDQLRRRSDPKPFALIGPGDIIGIHRDMIVRTEPRNWITNFEPNYLAFIEFYDEDFPWRYTPAQARRRAACGRGSSLLVLEGRRVRTRRSPPAAAGGQR